jgi:hypothetical protein
LLTLAGPILPNAEVVVDPSSGSEDIHVAGLPAALRQANLYSRSHFEPFLERRQQFGRARRMGLPKGGFPTWQRKTTSAFAAPAANSYYVK